MCLVRRLGRHLSYANVVASLALFAALGGSAYAASQINGDKIVKESIGAGKLKKETITSKQVKKGSLNSSVIDVSSLATVPSAQTAVTANSAATATSANSAATATKATSAETATNASHADSADSATTAGTATRADNAGDAETLEGETAAELTLSCPDETEGFGAMCWDEQEQGARTWIRAIEECAERGGRLPTIGELIAYTLLNGSKVAGENWSGDLDSVTAGHKEVVFTSDAGLRHSVDTTVFTTLAYRCVFAQTNAP
jgi:hypothetical protein